MFVWQIDRHASVKLNFNARFFRFRSGDLENSNIAVDPDHLGQRLIPFQQDRERMGAARKVQNAMIGSDPGMFHQGLFENGVPGGQPHDRVVSRRQPIVTQSGDELFLLRLHQGFTISVSHHFKISCVSRSFPELPVENEAVLFEEFPQPF